MAKIDVSEVLRPGLLDGVAILLAAGDETAPQAPRLPRPNAEQVQASCLALGAGLSRCTLVASGAPEHDDAEVEAAVAAALGGLGGLDMLVVDAAGASFHGPEGEPALIETLEAAWRLTRAVANAAFIAAVGDGEAEGGDTEGAGTGSSGGRIVYIAPPTAADRARRAEAERLGSYAEAARAGLENLARTLSIEWARYGITPVTIAPGPESSAEEVAALVAYLASPAGSYFSGCLLDLRGALG
ncbi:MAG TPA: SDR family oxidoreductase [Solirubrobacteraceae bacterium]|jgi:NAD(P)-dependent dehydrogenase (short-subunit alcohol dehydrogenase family)|nr:SDR family oxidoreductase [Solirubrobacteraceae bacterium]